MIFKKYIFTEDTLKRAELEASKIPKDLNGSNRKGGGRLLGILGEFIGLKVLGGNRVDQDIEDKYHWDIIYGNNTKIDMKSKEFKRELPLQDKMLYWDCSIEDFNTEQQCDEYGFVRCFIDSSGYKYGYYLGKITKKDFFEKAEFKKKGEKDSKSGIGGLGPDYYYPSDRHVLSIDHLDQSIPS